MGIVVSLAEKRAEKAEASAQARKMDIEEVVGLHHCTGDIIYSSKIVPDNSRPGVLVGGKPLMKTEVKCYCEFCKERFDPNNAEVQRRLTEILGES